MSAAERTMELVIAPRLVRRLSPVALGAAARFRRMLEPVMLPAVRELIELAVMSPARSPTTAKLATSANVPAQSAPTDAADTRDAWPTFHAPEASAPVTRALVSAGLPGGKPLPLTLSVPAKSPSTRRFRTTGTVIVEAWAPPIDSLLRRLPKVEVPFRTTPGALIERT